MQHKICDKKEPGFEGDCVHRFWMVSQPPEILKGKSWKTKRKTLFWTGSVVCVH